MGARTFWSFFLVVAVGSLVGVAKPNTVQAANRDLFPSAWIQVVTIQLTRSVDDVYFADVYFPAPPDAVRPAFEDAFPIVAMLQGGLVDKSHYEEFGMRLARFGFAVVIPNRLQVFGPPGTPPVPFPDQFVILDVLAQMQVEDTEPASLLFGIVDTDRMGLAGHSVGGVVGLFAIDGRCEPPFCFGLPFFPLPEEVQTGAFYGTNTCDPSGTVEEPRCEPGEKLIDIMTNSIPVALVQGSRDGVTPPAEAAATFDILDDARSLTSIEGANHYGIADVNNPPAVFPSVIPPGPDPNAPTLLQAESVQQVADAIGQFLRTHLTLCVHANPLLGAAQTCTVLPLNGVKVDMTGGAGGVFGDVCVEQNGKLSMSGSQFVNGSVLLSPAAIFSQSGSTTVEIVVEEVDLSPAITAALLAAQDAAAQPCTQTFDSLTTSQTIVGNNGLNVICVEKVEVKNNALITLSGGPNDSFIVNITGKFKINGGNDGGKMVVAGEVEPRDVLYNIIGTGAQVAFSGGGGGEDCCKARVDGTILALERKIGLSPGLVNGQIISGQDISLSGGASVSCPSVPADLIP